MTVHRTAGQRGYTLIELLIGVVIVAILAALATPAFLAQRRAGWASATTSDVRNTSLVVEALGTVDRYPDWILQSTRSVLLGHGETTAAPVAAIARTQGVTLSLARSGTRDYCVCGFHDRLGSSPIAVYDSAAGGMTDSCTIEDACPSPQEVPEQSIAVTLPAWGQPALITDPAMIIENGSLLIQGASFTGTDRHRGWAIAYGVETPAGRFTGYTLQIDPGHNGGSFIVREWRNGNEQFYNTTVGRHPLAEVAAPGDWDFSQARDIRAEVINGNELVLYATDNGVESILVSYEMGSDARDGYDGSAGSFGIRQWGSDSQVSHGQAQLIVP